MQLKNKTETLDPRLDRIEFHDPRSKRFPVMGRIRARKPRSYTWRCNAHLDQGREGACVGFGVAHELIARPAEAKGVDGIYAREIYKEAQQIDPWPGDNYEGTTVLAGVEIARKRGWIDGYYHAFGLDDLIMGVGYSGPAVLGVPWHEGMYAPDANGYITPTGVKMGGHCIVCKAIDVTGERFLLHNSWGDDWGPLGGDCYLTFDDMDFLLENGGEAVFFVGRHREVSSWTK